MLECDASGNVVSCNPAAERLLGEREAEMQGRPLAQHIATTGRTKPESVGVQTYFPSGDSSTQEVDILAHGVRVGRSVASFTRYPAPEGGARVRRGLCGSAAVKRTETRGHVK